MRFSQLSVLALALAAPLVSLAAPSSADCASCHSDVPASHRVGIDYEEVRAARANLRRDPRVLLVDGRIECVTCHLTHEEKAVENVPARLRASTVVLCAECHVISE